MCEMSFFRMLHFSTAVILFGFIFGVHCVGHHRRCYEIGDQEVCFFLPNSDFERVAWEAAWTTCRRLGATLPNIPSEAIQNTFETYLGSLRRGYVDGVWTAEREFRRQSWKWLNGRPFTELVRLEERPYYVQAILTDELNYEEDFPGNENKYVCQYFGRACQSEDSMSLSSGCLFLNNGEALTLYDARNRCVESGGDLAVIDSTADLERFREVFIRIRKATKLWIGLRRQWWFWNATDATPEMKYSNWMPDNGYKPDRDCSAIALDEYRWTQESCDCCKAIICQTGPAYSASSRTDKPRPTSPSKTVVSDPSIVITAVAASVTIVLIVLVVTIVVALVVKKRKTPRKKQVLPKESSYESLHQNLPERERFRNEHIYTKLQPPRREAQLRVAQNALQPMATRAKLHPPEQQQQNYVNEEEIGATRIPSYLELH